MKNLINTIKKISVLSLIIALTACGHNLSTQDFADTASPNDEISKFEADMNVAKSNQVDVLSPSNYKDAHDFLKSAKKGLDKENEAKSILHDVAQGRAYLKRANEFAQLSHDNIEEVIAARSLAIAAGAQESQKQAFNEAENNLTDITRNIEKNKLSDAIENKSKLQLTYLDLELKSIKQARLGQARNTIDQAIDEDAEKFAPRSLAIAEKSLQDADAYITANRHNTEQVSIRSEEAIKTSNHLLKITRDSKSGKKISSEEMALRMESEQTKVATKQNQLNKTQNQLKISKDRVAMGELANQALVDVNSKLESEQALNQLYEKARSEFTKDEAEVYKQGGMLTIRLRSLEFPNSQAVLRESNFELLAKVQKIIKSFGRSQVTIEGHTDSRGTELLNKELSLSRAEAVSKYLTANNTDEPMKIKGIGYGYEKPLASNKTAEGRAQNRRVDVLIQPDSTSL